MTHTPTLAMSPAPTPTMQAVVYDRYGGPEELAPAQVARPIPRAGEVLVRVRASSVNAADYRLLRADPFLARFDSGLLVPKKRILGSDVAGVVEEVGPGVTTLKVGDAVFGDTFLSGRGAFAEFVRAQASSLVPKPEALTFEEAASIPLAGVTALQAVRDAAKIRSGQSVLIQGAGGGVGTLLVQLARAGGAHVTAVCGPRSVELVASLGADRVLDYTQTDFRTRPERYDAIFGVNGHCPLGDYKARLNRGGTYVMVGGTNRQIFEALLLGRLRFLTSGKRMRVLTIDPKRIEDDLRELRALLEAGTLRPVIDRAFGFPEVAEAIRYVERGHVRGKVVVTMGR